MSAELNLLPCPFCGSSADSGNGFAPLESVTYAYCENSACPLHTVDVGFTPETWNRRTPLPVQAGEGEANAGREGGLLGASKTAETRMDAGLGGGHLPGANIALAVGQGTAIDYSALVDSMCLTLRHDFGLDHQQAGARPFGATSGMMPRERESLRTSMRQLVEHCIKPAIERAGGQGGEDGKLRERVLEAWANYERMGEVCSFEGNPMIYASTLEEIATLAKANDGEGA
jgi:hypothetical protein